MLQKKKKMAYLILSILISCIAGLLIYTYRWNMINPNKSGSFIIDNLKRTFVYHVPRKLNDKSKLMIVYHGSRLRAFMMQIFTGHEFDELADIDENTIIASPQGYEKNWNDCRKQSPYPAKQLNVDDVKFTEQIISFFKKEYQIDTTHIFAVGYSNGGQMVMKLAMQKPEWFKGFAVISANLPTESNNECVDTKRPVSLLLMNGTNDPINPYEGGEVILDGQSLGSVVSMEQNAQHWLNVSDCNSSEKVTVKFPQNKAGDNITAIQETYASRTNDKQISIIKVINGGHVIPNRNFRIPIKKLGEMNKDIDGPKVIWDFLMKLK